MAKKRPTPPAPKNWREEQERQSALLLEAQRDKVQQQAKPSSPTLREANAGHLIDALMDRAQKEGRPLTIRVGLSNCDIVHQVIPHPRPEAVNMKPYEPGTLGAASVEYR